MTVSTAQDDVGRSPSGPDHRAREIDLALDETRRALCRDESHVVVVAPPTAGRGLPTLLLNSLDTPLHAVVLSLAGREGQSADGCVLSALGLPPDGELETRAQLELEKLASSGSGLVLLLPDALGIEKTILRGLGRLAAATRRTLRLVLFVAPEQPCGVDPVATLVQALGVGAEKVVLGPPPREQAVLGTAALPSARPSLPSAGAPLSAEPGPLCPAPKQPYKAHKLKRRQPRGRISALWR